MYKKVYPKDLHKIYTSAFRDEPTIKVSATPPTSSALKPESIKNQKKHPNELQVEQPLSKRLKYQKG